MSDQGWAALGALAMVITMRVLDFFLPKGYISRRVRDHAVRVDDDEHPDTDPPRAP